MKPEIFGNFIEKFPPERDCLELTFTPSSQRIKQLWRNQRLSAHFVADYFVNFLPINQDDSEKDDQRIKETKGAVSYVANELLENAMKYNLETSQYKVKFGIQFLETSQVIAVMFVTNSLDRAGTEKFQAFIQELLASDPNEFYIRQVEASAEDEHAEVSGLGLITAIQDYHVKFGWKFETLQMEPEVLIVTTMAQLPV
jgi:hypothetical protein